jgi:DNA gyrase subunit A
VADIPAAEVEEENGDTVTLTADRIADMTAAEEILLTVTDGGFGKRSSAYDYRVSGRGGLGITNIMLAPRNGTAVVATLPVRRGDDVMLVTDAGRLIRVPADQVRITARQTMGVTLFRLGATERVTSVFPVIEDAALEEPQGDEDLPAPPDLPPEA